MRRNIFWVACVCGVLCVGLVSSLWAAPSVRHKGEFLRERDIQTAGYNLAMARNCLSCHAVDKRLVGPAYKDMAAKYKNDKTALEALAAKIQKGSAGVWGPIPMPANPQVTPDEAKKLAVWVLSQ